MIGSIIPTRESDNKLGVEETKEGKTENRNKRESLTYTDLGIRVFIEEFLGEE